MGDFTPSLSEELPSPFGRGAGGEGVAGSFANRPPPNPLPKGEGTKYPRQRGAILVVVLVCLAVATAISVVVVRQIATERHAVQMNHRSLQALWLAEGGIERAVARLAADPKYTGETWTIPANELAADDSGVVKIHVETIAGESERRSVRVEADYTDAPDRHCRQVKQIVVDRDANLSRQPTKGKRGQSPFAGTALRVLRTNGDCPLFPCQRRPIEAAKLMEVLL